MSFCFTYSSSFLIGKNMLLNGFCLFVSSFVSSIHLKKLSVCFPACLRGHELNKF